MWFRKKHGFFSCPKDIHFEILVIHDGAVHFISNCFPYIAHGSSYYRPYIMAYDIDNGTSKILHVPKEARRGSSGQSCKMGIYK